MSDDLLVARLTVECCEAQLESAETRLSDARADLHKAEIRDAGGRGPVVETTLPDFLLTLLFGLSDAQLQAIRVLRP